MVFFARRCRVCEVVNYVRAVHGLPKHPVDNDGRISDLYVTVYYVVHEDADMQGLVDEDDDDAAAEPQESLAAQLRAHPNTRGSYLRHAADTTEKDKTEQALEKQTSLSKAQTTKKKT
ncbi:uncharacterized protein PHALS_04810 [Plasmopara halstedii]|uniref:Uncharacterized protein n=1 Tax=Plasmopara halstedii TaxID=4781 RepID=A0A0P1B0U2_PLAHL|nr:uncharacterized protein PHALS_04810 [Plasmopara halstedii]CEG47662.1 hypothetical protein PHALS_04810 [Plasmopara halstedii]|eukprot:XP_024584031.1 hypothetical protein PHALS_04810 [Plasmopara halstedii]